MDNSSSWKTTISLTGQKISRIYLGNEVSLPSLCGSPIGPCPDLDKIKSNPSSYLVQTYFKIMSPFTLSLPCFLFPSGLLSHNLYAPLFHPTFAKRRQFFSSWFDNPNNIVEETTHEALHYAVFCTLIPRGFKRCLDSFFLSFSQTKTHTLLL